ncbi:MAG: N-acetylmuramoyl-L-alanine amidase [Rubrobacter sp.]|nr:N-acetylmuramoyl-L-alanine amidase [Rubrobacter sp.]
MMEDQSGQANAEGLPAEESFRASLAMDTMEMEDAAAVSGVPAPNIHRFIQCRGATPMSRGKHNIDTIVLHTPEGYVPGTLSVLSGTRAGFDWYLPPSGELYKCNDYLRYFSWHAGDLGYNRRSIGIEQWDFAQNMPNAPDAHYQRLARLCAYLVETLDLAIRHAKNYGEYGFIAHGTVTPHARWDPGNFDYEKLLSLVSDLVKGRPELKLDPVDGDPSNGDPPNGGPRKKIWLPGLKRIAAGAFDETHLGEARVMTLDGTDRAVVVPKGVAMNVPKPGETTENPIVEPDDPAFRPPWIPKGSASPPSLTDTSPLSPRASLRTPRSER